jgi:hypothetical protein
MGSSSSSHGEKLPQETRKAHTVKLANVPKSVAFLEGIKKIGTRN